MGLRRSVIVVFLALSPFAAAWGGIHNSAEPPVPLDNDLKSFLNRLADLRSLAPSDPTTMVGQVRQTDREAYLQKIEALRKKQKAGTLTADEAANLGAYLYRVRKTSPRLPDLQEAIQALEEARRKHPRHFAILSNLGTAYQASGALDAAESCLEEALTLAPPEALAAEKLQLLLVRRRAREARSPQGPPLDALFFTNPREPLRFVGPSGRYEIGALAPAEKAKLPGGSVEKATQLVQQLLTSMPEDGRLHWLLGELAAAQDQPKAAAETFRICVDNFRMSTPELKLHRSLLLEYVAWSGTLERLGPQARQAAWLGEWFAVAVAGGRPFGAAEMLLGLAQQAGPLQPKSLLDQLGQGGLAGEAAPARPLFTFDMISWPVVLGGAAVIVLLAGLQVREWLKRRRRLSRS